MKSIVLNHEFLVEIPAEKGIHRRAAGRNKETYIYKYLSHTRTENGNNKHTAICLGKLHAETGKMSPNKNYLDLYGVEPDMGSSACLAYGFNFLVWSVSRKIGLAECLEGVFGKGVDEILAVAAYMIWGGNIMDSIDDWQGDHFIPRLEKRLTSQSTSRLFSDITDNAAQRFFKNWIALNITVQSVCYDVTSISSYASEMATVEFGYNRDHEKITQFNLGVFCDEASKTPLYYSRYSGSLTDRTNLPNALEEAREVGIENAKLVLDGGFWGLEDFKALKKIAKAFTVGFPAYLPEAQKLISEYGEETKRYAHKTGYAHIHCKEVVMTVHGVNGKALLFFDYMNHVDFRRQLDSHVGRVKLELAKRKQFRPYKGDYYKDYFTLSKKEGCGIHVKVEDGLVEERMSQGGYFLLFSTDMDATPDSLLFHYRAKDAVEKLFAQIKVEMDGNRVRTHGEGRTDGKTFVTFIAGIIRTALLVKLSPYLDANSTSLKKAFSQLANIQVRSSADGISIRNALTKKQKEIFSLFEINEEMLKNSDEL